MAVCPVAHFACHGISDPADPSRSRLLLRDHHDRPLTVSALSSVHLRHARLAYLSACDTALSSHVRLIDEAIHLASAFQLAGYPHVIGTLWAIDDHVAVQVADAFYAKITSGRSGWGLDVGQAAVALHEAVRAIRDALPATPSLWASHIHAGA
jgi:CHAT domain-containing protein